MVCNLLSIIIVFLDVYLSFNWYNYIFYRMFYVIFLFFFLEFNLRLVKINVKFWCMRYGDVCVWNYVLIL